ncbi:hypothetical protein KXV85_003687, partial [Aspergillus fumigatus]
HVDHDLALGNSCGNAVGAEQHGLDMRRVRHHDDNDVGLLGDFPAGFAGDATAVDQLLRQRRDVVQEQLVLSRLEMASHRAPHGAEADETDFHDVSSLGLEDLRRMPAEPVDGCGSRLVFTSHPATIADRIEMAKQERIVDLAGAGLVAARIVGDLDMANARQMFLQAARDVPLHDLHM